MPTIKELRQKLIVRGAEALTDAELLAVVIREGTDLVPALEMAGKMLDDFGGSLSDLASSTPESIRRAGGCGTNRAVVIAAVGEISRRITGEKALSIDTIECKEDVAQLFAPLADLPHEEFWVLYLTSGGKVLNRTKVSQGGVSGTVVDNKLIVKRAVELLSTSIILVHNHPSGVARPSSDDTSVTEMVVRAAGLFDIKVIDHVIIAAGGCYSFRENGLI